MTNSRRQLRWLRRGAVVAIGALLTAGYAATPAWAVPPDKPAPPTVTRGPAQVTADFTAPSNSGPAIDSYTATCDSSDGGVSGSATELAATMPPFSITVTGLTNGKTYTCTILATNADGPSPPSDPSLAVVPADVPDTPAAPTVTAGNMSAMVSFTPPADNGDPITSYTAACTSSDGGAFGSASGATSPITVIGLTANKTYTCSVTATNGVGESNASENSISFMPEAVPDAPVITGVVRGNASVDVSFSAPPDNGNAITSFTATCTSSNGGAPGSKTGTTTLLTVTGLTNARTYRCTVRATNSFGNGPPSAPSATVVPATAPNPPTIGSPDPGDGAAAVRFTPQSNNGATITSYTATCTSSDGGVAGSATGTKSPVVVSGLDNGHLYTCTATATNAMGTGGASAASPALIVGEPVHPTIATIVPGNANSSVGTFTVSLTPGAANGSPITSYGLTCRPATTGATRSVTSTSSQVQVNGLATGRSYSCTAVATNARGTSRESLAVSAIVGSPGPPKITKVAPLSHGLAFAFLGANPNGTPVIDYRVRCTSSNGGVSQSARGTESPISAGNLSVGGRYTCALTARNARGEGAPATVGPIVVKPPTGKSLATCTGTTGTVSIDPGMQQKTAQTHTFGLKATLGCSGPYVNAASVSFSLHTKRPASCGSVTGLANSGPGTLRWTAPLGMGKSLGTIQLTITATGNHKTKATYFGTISSGNSIFKGAHVSGTLLLGRGFHAASAGGDCSSTTPIASMPVTTITMTVS